MKHKFLCFLQQYSRILKYWFPLFVLIFSLAATLLSIFFLKYYLFYLVVLKDFDVLKTVLDFVKSYYVGFSDIFIVPEQFFPMESEALMESFNGDIFFTVEN